MSELADFTSERIEGYEKFGMQHFSVPLVTHVEGNLYMGGCPSFSAPPFGAILNLYGATYQHRTPAYREHRLRDSHDGVPSRELLDELADWIAGQLACGRTTYVHCQAGLNRSSLVIAYYLVTRCGRRAEEAIGALRERRCGAVLCNEAFERFLLSLDETDEE